MEHHVRETLICLALVMISRGVAGRSSHVTPATVLAIEHWSHAVVEHTPGAPDAAVTFVRSLSYEARQDMDGGMQPFLRALLGKNPVWSSAEEKRVVEVGVADLQSVGANAFLERAAVLHADAVMVGGAAPSEPLGRAGSGQIAKQAPSTSPLLSTSRLILANDGEAVGALETNWNWTFARALLDMVSPKPAAVPFIGQWYHATAAYLLRHGEYGEVETHLAHAGALLPHDPHILFDRACLLEILGLPQSQQLLTDQDRVARRIDATRAGVTLGSPERARRVDIPFEEVANENAERLFRNTLQMAPTFVEARVRLARLLEVRGRFADALTELSTAVSDRGVAHDPVVLFYAELFAGRADHALGRSDAAARHEDAAVALFPNAQSALLARSQLALVTADVDGALAPIGRLAALPVDAARRMDPWWQYPFGPGRDADTLLGQMWASLSR